MSVDKKSPDKLWTSIAKNFSWIKKYNKVCDYNLSQGKIE